MKKCIALLACLLLMLTVCAACAETGEEFFGIWEGEMDGYQAKLYLTPDEMYLIPDMKIEEFSFPCTITGDDEPILNIYALSMEPLSYPMHFSNDSIDFLALGNQYSFKRVSRYSATTGAGSIPSGPESAGMIKLDYEQPHLGRWMEVSADGAVVLEVYPDNLLKFFYKQGNQTVVYHGAYEFDGVNVKISSIWYTNSVTYAELNEQISALFRNASFTVNGNLLNMKGMPPLKREYEYKPEMEDKFSWRVLEDGTAEITGWYGQGTKAVVPDQIDGVTVTSIGENAFYGCTAEEIILPDTLTLLQYHSVYSCTQLKQLVVPEGVTSLSNYAISYVPAMETLTLPFSLEIQQDDRPVSNSPETMTLNAPKGSKAHQWAQANASLFAGVVATEPDENAFRLEYKKQADGTMIITGYIGYRKAVEIPAQIDGATVTAIGEKAFSNSQMESIILPDSLQKIGSQAFLDCEELKTLTIQEGVKAIPDGFVRGCSSLTEITLPSTVTSIGTGAFAYCNNLKAIVLPQGVTAVPASMVKGCIRLESITLPSSIRTIGKEAFANCKALTEAAIPEGVTELPAKLFSGCDALTKVTVPKSVERIGENCFTQTDHLIIYGYYSSGLERWAEMMAVDELTVYHVQLEQAPPENDYLTDYSLRYTVNDAKEATIVGYDRELPAGTYLQLTVPDLLGLPDAANVRAIGDNAFAGWGNIISLDLPYRLSSIGNSAFEGCFGLKELSLPKGLTQIGEKAFFNCTGIKEVTIPEKVTHIGAYAFDGCTALRTIYLSANVMEIGTQAFPTSAKLIVPEGSYAHQWAQNNGYEHGTVSDVQVTLKERWSTGNNFESGEELTLIFHKDGTYVYQRFDLISFEKTVVREGTYYIEGLTIQLENNGKTTSIQLESATPTSITFWGDTFY